MQMLARTNYWCRVGMLKYSFSIEEAHPTSRLGNRGIRDAYWSEKTHRLVVIRYRMSERTQVAMWRKYHAVFCPSETEEVKE